MLIFAVRSYLTRFNGGVHPVGTVTENRACGLVHFNLIHTTCIRYMYLYFFSGTLSSCWDVSLCFYFIVGFSLFLSLFDVSFFLSSCWDVSLCFYFIVGFFSVSILIWCFFLSFFSFLFFSFLFFSMGKGFWWQREWKLNQKTIIKLLFFISI